MSKLVDNHPLGRDLPNERERIHHLKTTNAHFSRLMEQYEDLDREIVRAEQGIDHLSDLALEELKVKRVRQKDALYKMIVDSKQSK